jgi:perosamine synthetase
MQMRIGKTMPPAAAPLGYRDILRGLGGLVEGAAAVTRFEKELGDAFRSRYCFAVSSGKAALTLILQALRELAPERDEVLIPAYTCYSVPSAIVRAGLKVRLCDLAPESLDYDFRQLGIHLRHPRLLCVIAIHLFGVPADVERVKRMAAGQGVVVVEDAAQAMGAEWNGRKLGTLGDVGLFSMGRGKAFSTVEGGVVLTGSERIGRAIAGVMAGVGEYGGLERIRLVAYALALWVLIHPRLYWLPKALPFLKLGETIYDPSFPVRRLSPFQAGLASAWRSRIEELRRTRRRNSREIAGRGVAPHGFAAAELPDLIRFPVLMADRERKERLLRAGERLGLGLSHCYPDTVAALGRVGDAQVSGHFPRARELAERIVSLPVHPFVGQQDIDTAVGLLRLNP